MESIPQDPQAKFEGESGMAILPQPTGEEKETKEVKETRKEKDKSDKSDKDVMMYFTKLQVDNWTKDEPPKRAKDGAPEIGQAHLQVQMCLQCTAHHVAGHITPFRYISI